MTRVGRKVQRRLPTQAPLEFTCGEKHVHGVETACGFGEPCRAPAGWGGGPQERLAGARTEGPWMSPEEAGLHSRGTTHTDLSPKKTPLLPLLRVGGGPGRQCLQHSSTRLARIGRGLGRGRGDSQRPSGQS